MHHSRWVPGFAPVFVAATREPRIQETATSAYTPRSSRTKPSIFTTLAGPAFTQNPVHSHTVNFTGRIAPAKLQAISVLPFVPRVTTAFTQMRPSDSCF